MEIHTRRKVTFFAVISPKDENIEMNMMIGHGQNYDKKETLFTFLSNKITFRFSTFENVLFCTLPMEFVETFADGVVQRKFVSPYGEIPCGDYQMNMCRKFLLSFLTNYYY